MSNTQMIVTQKKENDQAVTPADNMSEYVFSAEELADETLMSTLRSELAASLGRNKDGKTTNSIENGVAVLENDPLLKKAIRKNLFTGCMNVFGKMPWHREGQMFNDDDLAFIQLIFEKYYGINSKDKILTSLRIVSNRLGFHPVRSYLNGLTWDGTPRVRFALHHFLGADISNFNEECLRLFMLGAVNRVFHPGRKFDLMLCLTGGQGAGKSTFFRFLAGNDDWFSDDLRKLDDDNVYRRMMGHWIIEMSEMIATVNAKSVEEIKSFLSRQKDNYKIPYDKFPCDWPRQCVFAGTTNKIDFLPHDRTGNRRFLPIRVDADKAEVHILADPAASREYFDQMWAEIMEIYRSGEYTLKLSKEAVQILKHEQANYMPEDSTAGQIIDFMEHTQHTQVCSLLLYVEALGYSNDKPQAWERRNICDIVNNAISNGELKGWHAYTDSRRFAKYGKQRGWERDNQAGKVEQENRNKMQIKQMEFAVVENPPDFPF